MKTNAILTVGFVLAAISAYAQDENAVLKQELSAAPAAASAPQPVNVVTNVQTPVRQEVTAPVAVQAASQASSPVYIIEKQPTTVVEDVPLKESKADQLRKAREEVERQTEEKIVERLESDRVRAEQERANKLLGNLDNKATVAPVAVEPSVQAPPPPTVIYVAQPQAAPSVPATVTPSPAVQEVKSDISKEELVVAKAIKDPMLVSADMGFIAYPSTYNVSNGFVGGVSIGKVFDKNLLFDLAFAYSSLDIETLNGYYPYNPNFPIITELSQYNYSANVKYRIINSTFSPTVGGTMSYTVRNYYSDNVYAQPLIEDPASSWALDFGLSAGVDIQLSRKFSLGIDYKYMFNVAYDVESQYEKSKLFTGPLAYKDLEEVNYYTFTVKGILLF